MISESSSADKGRPDPGAMPGTGIDLNRLRQHVEDLLDQAITAGEIVTVKTEGSDADSEHETNAVTAEPHYEELVEITAEQLDALNSAHDALAYALASLDSGRK